MDRNPRLAIFWKNLCTPNRGDFFCRAHKGIHLIAQRRFEALSYLRFKPMGIVTLLEKTIFPLAINVSTSSNPSSSNRALS
jgi:hypothetical protein